MAAARWRWQVLDDAGTVVADNVGPGFGSRFDAETWLGEHWRTVVAEARGDDPRGLGAQLHRDDELVGPVVQLRDPEA